MGWYDKDDEETLRLMAVRFIEVADVLAHMKEVDPDLDVNVYVPEYYGEFSENVTIHNGWDSTTQKYNVDREASLAKIARIAAALPGKRDKVMDDDGLRITLTTANGATLEFSTDKEVTCRAKVVGQEWVEPYNPTPREGYMKDIVEWECDEVVLLQHKS